MEAVFTFLSERENGKDYSDAISHDRPGYLQVVRMQQFDGLQ
jgi:hypothetical protein